MTPAELKYHVLLGVDKHFENAAPGYNDIQMSAILNKAQRRVFKKYRELFDRDEKVRKILSPVLSRGSLLEADIIKSNDNTYTHPNGWFYALPEGTAYLVEEYVTLDLGTNPATYSDPVLVYPITYDYYVKNYKNRYKKPHTDLVWRLEAGYENEDELYVVELITDGVYEIYDYFIVYLRYPTDIIVDITGVEETPCEIVDQGFHDEIVSEAIKIIVAALNDEGYQVAAAERTFD